MATKSEEQTPLMQQYYSAKAKYPDAFYYIGWVTFTKPSAKMPS